MLQSPQVPMFRHRQKTHAEHDRSAAYNDRFKDARVASGHFFISGGKMSANSSLLLVRG